MDFSFTEEQEELRETARAFLAEHASSEAVRAAMEAEHGHDPATWKRIGAELGWTAITIPEAHGGLGLTEVELVALLEVMGEVLLPSPYFATVALGANALLVAGSDAQKDAWLPGIAEGQTRATLAVPGAGGRWNVAGVEATCRADGDGHVLSGVARHVVDGACADLVIVAARAEGSSGDVGVSLFAVPGDAPGLERRALPTMDRTRRLAELRMDGLRVPASARLGDEGAAAPALREILDRAFVALAAEQVGGAQRCLDMSVAYAKERVQFGRPIGSFQAIKHKCADMMVAVESARSVAYYAGCVAAEGSAELPAVASMAKAWCSEAYFRCAAESIQIHGGVGITWEYDCHLHFKRARAGEAFLGTPAEHRERVAVAMGLDA
ncbi:MAG TPA: acyl-CoA dehydrogenase family protein [Myxococcota bacterium]|nr:acyl-CoA dehydrogenase family protein [Myxococcota bacterium]